METDSRSYQYLIEKFSSESLIQRFELIYGKAKKFISAVGLEGIATINEYLVDEVIIDYFADIARLKDFHHIEKTQPAKVAAYTAYWVSRKKPIQLLRQPNDPEILKFPGFAVINEMFACTLLISMVYDTKKPLLVNWGNYNTFQKVLKYHLAYRQTTAQMLELVLYALDTTPVYEKIG
ncbi:MAG: hypothetical protein OEV78_04065 [Spirochaetia bacterium]|nr:hypothetical protein [Spirochaetia bacterium]